MFFDKLDLWVCDASADWFRLPAPLRVARLLSCLEAKLFQFGGQNTPFGVGLTVLLTKLLTVLGIGQNTV